VFAFTLSSVRNSDFVVLSRSILYLKEMTKSMVDVSKEFW